MDRNDRAPRPVVSFKGRLGNARHPGAPQLSAWRTSTICDLGHVDSEPKEGLLEAAP